MPLSARSVRRGLLVAMAIAVIVFAACTPAWAGEGDATESAVADTTALARTAIANGELDDALRLLARVIVSERSDDERAAANELRAVVERWVQLGRTIAPPGGTDAPPTPSAEGRREPGVEVTVGDAWEGGFAVARGRLLAGRFEDAAADFGILLAAASTQRTILRAHVLASLASELVGKGVVLRAKERSPVAAGGGSPDYHRDPRATGRRWYGWQTLIADGATVTLVPAVASQLDSDGTAIAVGMVGSYLLAAPIIHLAHGRPGIAAASLGLRAGLPMGGALLGAALAGDCRGELCGAGGAVIGFVVGILGATTLDAVVLSREPREDDESNSDDDARSAPPQVKRGFALTPTGGPRKEGGFDLGVGAIF
jgi:hypothetical protein